MAPNSREIEISRCADQIVATWPDTWFLPIPGEPWAHVSKLKFTLGEGMDLSGDASIGIEKILALLGPDEFRAQIVHILSEARNRVLINRQRQFQERKQAEKREKALLAEERRRAHEQALKAEKAAQAKAREETLLEFQRTVTSLFATDFKSADRAFLGNPDWREFATEFQILKSSFLDQWFRNDAAASGRKLPALDYEQLLAIGSIDGNFEVVARAGSGKTLVSVLRAYFLIKHCAVRPNEILLLAFNRDAALEIRRRLLFLFKPDAEKLFETSKRYKLSHNSEKGHKTIFEIESEVIGELVEKLGVELPFAMTFHALAYAIVRPEGTVLKDDPNTNDDSLSGTVQLLVNEVLKDEAKAQSIRDLMMRHFKNDWEFLNSDEYGMSGEELLLWRRSLPNQTIDGLYRKSAGEKLISDFLFEHSIEYHYERNVWWGDTNYKPDFTILKPGNRNSGLVIEYFGLVDDPAYLKQVERKRRFWEQKDGWTLVELYPEDVAQGIDKIEAIIAPFILDIGISIKKLTDEEIWKLIEGDAILQYTRLLTGFSTRCRQVGLNSSRLKAEIDLHSPSKRSVEWLFLRQADYLYGLYESTLIANDQTDFSELMANAVGNIQSGSMDFYRKSGNGNLATLRYITVDEFQDFSFLFDSMIKAIAKNNHKVSLFCVGDDWQAINGFAGSDLVYFEEFLESVPNSKRIYLSTNYRSDASVVNFGNSIMSGNGREAIASKSSLNLPLIGYLDEIVLTATEMERSESDLITPAILRIIESQLTLDRDVVVLSRTNTIPYYTDSSESGNKVKNLDSFLKHLQSYFPEEIAKRISISSAHRYKGRERQAVILLDASEKRYPLIHRDWVFSRIFGIDLNVLADDDRRLFYVAVTRAIDQLFVLSESRETLSPYVDVEGHGHAELHWDKYRAPATKVNPVIVQLTDIHRGSTYSIRELLTAGAFKWSAAAKIWHKAFLPEAFSVDALKLQSWASRQLDAPETRILVSVSAEPHGEIAQFEVRDGEWITRFDRLALLDRESTN